LVGWLVSVYLSVRQNFQTLQILLSPRVLADNIQHYFTQILKRTQELTSHILNVTSLSTRTHQLSWHENKTRISL